MFEYIVEVDKYNPYHDRLGRFTTAGGASSASFRSGSRAQSAGVSRVKRRRSDGGGSLKVKTPSSEPRKYKEKNSQGQEVDAYTKPPKGWKEIKGATTAPNGYTWYSNGKSQFSGQRKQALVRNKQYDYFYDKNGNKRSKQESSKLLEQAVKQGKI